MREVLFEGLFYIDMLLIPRYAEPVTVEELRIAGEQLVPSLREEMSREERQFIYLLKRENPGGICPGFLESRLFLLFNGSFRTYAEWRLPNTGRHYENSGITSAHSHLFNVSSSTPFQIAEISQVVLEPPSVTFPSPRMVIEMEGGLIQNITANVKTKVLVLDADTEGEVEDRIRKIINWDESR